MSRIGRLPVEIPAGVEVTVAENNVVTVKGPKGTLTESLPVEMDIKVENNQVYLKDTKRSLKSTVLVTELRNRARNLFFLLDILIL